MKTTTTRPGSESDRESKLQQAAREFRLTKTGGAALAPGWTITTEFRTEGGKSYTRTPLSTETDAEKKLILTSIPDDKRLDEFAKQTINRADYLMEKYCAPMFAGVYYCADEILPELQHAMEECQIAAADCNAAARELKSKRETRIQIYPSILDVNNVTIGMRFAEMTHKRLLTLRDAYTKQPIIYRNAYARVRNAWQAVIGKQRETLRIALNSGQAQRENGLMIFHAGGQRNTKDLLRQYSDPAKVPPLDYAPLDAAIEMFAPAAGWSVRTDIK